MTNTTRPADGARPSDTTQARKATTHALDSSRRFATGAVGRIGDTARDLRDGAAELARTGAESVNDAMVAAQGQLGKYASATRRQVAREPFKAALIAAAVGAAVAALVLVISGSRRHTDRER
jgi:hypothetical protein